MEFDLGALLAGGAGGGYPYMGAAPNAINPPSWLWGKPPFENDPVAAPAPQPAPVPGPITPAAAQPVPTPTTVPRPNYLQDPSLPPIQQLPATPLPPAASAAMDREASVGAALTGLTARPPAATGAIQGPAARGPGAPLNIVPPGNPNAPPVDANAQQSKGASDRLMETLKGVKMPAGPELQRLGTPAAPRPTTAIKGGELLALLAAAGGQAPGGADYKLPSTLGMALAGRR